jgi:hypothetical protein
VRTSVAVAAECFVVAIVVLAAALAALAAAITPVELSRPA